MEIFAASAFVVSKTAFLQILIQRLSVPNHQSQVLASYFIIIGHLLEYTGLMGHGSPQVSDGLSPKEIKDLGIIVLNCRKWSPRKLI